ncbi:MAG: AI-2E family transporter [Patescibacteria group bacterium]
MHSSRKVELGFFLLLVFIAAALSFLLFKPYLGALFVALVFAIVFRSSYEAIHAKIKRSTLSSLATLLFVFSVILIPAGLFAFLVFDDAEKLYSAAGSGVPMFERFDTAFAPIETYVQKIIPEFEIKLSTYAHAAIAFLVDNFGNVFSRVVTIVFQTFIMLLALFFLFRDGGKFRAYVIYLSPLANEYDERILKRLETAITSVVKGKLLIVLIQGILASVGFWLFGVPHAVLWGALTSIAALIPAFGVALVFIPILIYLFATGSLGITIGFVVFAIFVGAIDNILGPVLFEKGMQMHPLLILLSVLGGLAFFGPVGFLAGPVVLSLLFALLDIYPLLFSEQKR